MRKQWRREPNQYGDANPLDYTNFLILSLGTGTEKKGNKYTAKEAASWGVLEWILNGGSAPIIDVFSQASVDIVDIHIATILQAAKCEANYLRIQVTSMNKKINNAFSFFSR